MKGDPRRYQSWSHRCEMRVDVGITNVGTAGTAVQISNVTSSIGYELSAGNEIELNFGEFGGSVPANVFYVDAASNNDKVSWVMILEG